MIPREEIIAAAKEAGLFIGSDDNPATALWWYPEVERFANHFYEAGAASRDAEINTLRELKQAWHDKFWELDKTQQLQRPMPAPQRSEQGEQNELPARKSD